MTSRAVTSRAVTWRPLALLAVVCAVAAASWQVRAANGLCIAAAEADGGEAAWFVHDPDSLYHMRRVERALDEGRVAPRDPLLAWPDHVDEGGAPIPWPGTYTRVLAALAGAGAPEDGRQREVHVEHAVASWPARFGAATSALAALAAGVLAGPLAALAAGLCHATLFASLKYSYLGQGDHHAWVSLLHAAWLALAGASLTPAALARRGPSAARGAACGVLAGALLGSWVASLVFVVLFQAALGVLVLGHAWRAARPGLAPFGLAFHAAALAVLAPEVAASPWGPFAVVELSWFHAAELAAGGAVFVPLLFVREGGGALARYPWIVLAIVAVLVGAVLVGPVGAGVAEAFAWAGGANDFMANIAESQPLLGGPAGGWGPLAKWLGAGVLALPVAWLAACRARDPRLLPWLVAVPALAAMAVAQRRFGDALGAPMAVLLGWGWGRIATRARRLPSVALLAGATVVLAVALSPGPARTAWARSVRGLTFVETPALARERGLRELCRWLREHTAGDGSWSVLAQWDLGHLIEWAARRPTVATNFGSYLGEDAFLDPWRFLLATDDARAEEILERRRARYVLFASDWRRNLDTMTRVLGRGAEGSVAERLAREAGVGGPDFLRLVSSTRIRLGGRDAGPAGRLFERVPGARLVARGEAGQRLEVRLELCYPGEPEPLVWRRSATVGPDGTARLRVPYTTEANNGVGRSVGPLAWSLGDRTGRLAVPELAVLSGDTVRLP